MKRKFEKLSLVFGYILIAIQLLLSPQEADLTAVSTIMLMLALILHGSIYAKEHLRFQQLFYILGYLIYTTIVLTTYKSQTATWIFLPFLLTSTYLYIRYGEPDLDKIKLTGKYKVGYASFFSQKMGSECSIFYPTEQTST